MDIVKMALHEIAYFDISVPASFPSPAADYVEESINLHDFLVKNSVATFLVKCTGLSMINAFIPPVAYLLIDRSVIPQNGDIVLAYLEGHGFTVKYLEKNDFKCRLLPANPKFHPIEITEESGLMVWGVVSKIISDPKDYKHVCFG